MAKQITQRVALSGGNEFRAGLKALGTAGQEAFTNIQQATKKANTAAVQLAPVIDAVKRKVKELATAGREMGTAFGEASTKIKEAGTRIGVVTVALTGAAAGFAALVKGAADTADEAGKTATALGMNVKELQNLQYAAGASNMSNEQLEKGLLKLAASANMSEKRTLTLQNQQREYFHQLQTGQSTFAEYQENIRKLGESNTEAIDPFNRLGISVRDANGKLKDSHQLLYDLADAFQRSNDSALKLQITTEIFGTRAGKPFIDLLNQGSAGLREMEREGQRLAPAFNDAEVAIGQKFGDTLDSLGRTVDSIRHKFFLLFGPSLTVLMKDFQLFLANNSQAIQTFGEEIAGRLRPIISDLGSLLRGDFISPNGVVAKLRDGILTFVADAKQAIGVLISAWNGLVAVLDVIARIINTVFGTQLTGQALAIVAAFSAFTGILGALASIATVVVLSIGLLATAFGGVEVAIAAAGVALGYYFGQVFLDLLAAAQTAASNVADAIGNAFSDAGGFIRSAWDGVFDFLSGKWTAFASFVIDKIAAIRAAMSTISGVFGFGSGAEGKADGGPIRGPGTGTSDSVPIWASNGEYMMKARAVGHYGVGFMEAINNMRLPSFSTGGLVDGLAGAMSSIMPRTHYADGGLVAAPAASGGRPVVFNLDGQAFGPFTAGEETVSRLERFAANRQARSAGRKPTWAGSR